MVTSHVVSDGVCCRNGWHVDVVTDHSASPVVQLGGVGRVGGMVGRVGGMVGRVGGMVGRVGGMVGRVGGMVRRVGGMRGLRRWEV